MIFKSRNLINTLKNNGSAIINVKQSYPSKANVSIVKGLAQPNANTRVTSVYVYMEFDRSETRNDTNPGEIAVKITHLGHNNFHIGNNQWTQMDTSMLSEVTGFINSPHALTSSEQQYQATQQMNRNAFDCSKTSPTGDLLGETMCPGLYSDYAIEIPRSDDLDCPKIRSGTNCKDLDLSMLKAIHFHAEVMY